MCTIKTCDEEYSYANTTSTVWMDIIEKNDLSAN